MSTRQNLCPLDNPFCPLDTPSCPLDKPLGWGKPSLSAVAGKAKEDRQVVDIFRCPLDNFDHLTDRAKTRNRQTQTTPADLPFQLIEKREKWWLVKLADGTFGWIPGKFVEQVRDLNYWDKIKLAPKNKTTPLPYPTPTKIRRVLSEFKGIPYLWGGAAKPGMDCSAFVQKVFLKLFGILLPRNSRGQKKCGKFVYLKSICPLDILFFVHSTTNTTRTKKTADKRIVDRQSNLSTRQAVDKNLCPVDTGRHHVGVYFDKKVWHFCLDKKGLSIESLEEIKKRYRYLTARRIIKSKEC